MFAEKFADQSTGREAVALHDVRARQIRKTVQLWRDLGGARAYPSWGDINPRYFRSVLSHLFIARVVGNCDDYETRIAGDSHLQALDLPVWPHRISDVDLLSAGYAAILKPLYDRVVETRAPHAIRSWVKRNSEALPYLTSESAFMPLGPDADCVDHVLVSSVYTPAGVKRPGGN